ncbi:ABC transporter permease [Luteipulveratus mongoliensis]|uniref:Peptide ABC transporter permease n=1 Tax=Luteipulveratus mongoliensis TaxID=571913 RepID=A0A0K1JGD7_9MICO|nr:ABC transporter permease [Luteipulveratus mongoliensis]AKU15658.1 peptide ABC transporter permease [Luteipulveratus mongoliensis]
MTFSPGPPDQAAIDAPSAKAASVLGRLRHDRAAMVGLIVIVVMVLAALAAPLVAGLSGQDPTTWHHEVLGEDGSPRGAFGGVSGAHWFGVEPLTGRDLFAIVVHGARTSILVGIGATFIAVTLGVLVGATAALFGGWYDRVASRVIDVLFGFPSLIFMISLGALAPDSVPRWLLVILVIGLFGWPPVARVIRGQSLALMGRDFVSASRAMGAGPWHVLREQLLPNLGSTIIVFTTMRIPSSIGAEAALSFLGVGVPPPTPAWGRTIGTAIGWIASDPWYLLAPASALFAITLAFNLLGDGLRDALDPRLTRRR